MESDKALESVAPSVQSLEKKNEEETFNCTTSTMDCITVRRMPYQHNVKDSAGATGRNA